VNESLLADAFRRQSSTLGKLRDLLRHMSRLMGLEVSEFTRKKFRRVQRRNRARRHLISWANRHNGHEYRVIGIEYSLHGEPPTDGTPFEDLAKISLVLDTRSRRIVRLESQRSDVYVSVQSVTLNGTPVHSSSVRRCILPAHSHLIVIRIPPYWSRKRPPLPAVEPAMEDSEVIP